jgi:APA family basic amino acid/polyamine antiporter
MTSERPLGARHVAAVTIGATIGVGIFFTPSTLARAVPTPAWVLALWVVGGIAAVSGSLVFAALGVRWPRAGGIYVFLREGFGPRRGPALSFLYGWIQLLVIQPGAMGVIALVLVDNLIYLVGPLSPLARSLAACAAILTFTVANLLGLRTGGRIQVAVAALKLAALAALIGVGIGVGRLERLAARPPPATLTDAGGWASWMLFGLIPILFTFGGSYHGTFIAGSVKDPERSIPRGILLGIGAVLVAYLGVNVAYLAVLGQEGLGASASPAADSIAVALGASAGRIVAAAIVVSACGILNTICLGFPFVIYAMANDGVFFARAGRLHPRTGRPSLAIALQGAVACAAVLVGSSRVGVLLTGIAFADATFQAATAWIIVAPGTPDGTDGTDGTARTATASATLRAAGWTFVVIELGVALGSLVRAPAESAYGVAVLVLGTVAWLWWKRTR